MLGFQTTKGNYEASIAFAAAHNYKLEIVDFAYPKRPAEKLLKFYTQHRSTHTISMHGQFIDIYLQSWNPEVFAIAQKQLWENINIARKLRLKYLIFHSNFLPRLQNTKWLERNTEFWKKALRKYKGTILLENLWDASPDLLKKLCDAVASPRLKICFDVGHAHVFSKVPLEEWFKVLGKHITYIHINDNAGDKDAELPLGQGTINWKNVNAYVKKYCNEPVIVLEMGGLCLSEVEESITFIKKHKLTHLS